MEELFLRTTGIISWVILISIFGPIILLGAIQFLLACFAIVFHFIICIFNPKYLIDFYTSTENYDYE